MRVALVRGAYLNEFEAQNYIFDKKNVEIVGVGSLHSISTDLPFEVIRYPSITDLTDIPNLPFRGFTKKIIKYVSNRTLGDSQILFNLESLADKFDIFHTADSHYYYSYQLARLRALGKIKHLIMTSWETIPFNNEKTSQKKMLKRFVLEKVDAAVCHTVKAADALVKEGFSPSKICRVNLGVDLKRFTPRNDIRSMPRLVFVGRLVEEKGIVNTIDAVIRVMHSLTIKFDFQIVGSGPLKEALQDKIRKNNLTDRIIISEIKYRDILKVYSTADILVAPSIKISTWEEQYGMVFAEAMASGLAVITSNSGAIGEVVGDAALIIDEVTTENIYKAIIRLLSNYGQLEKYKILSLKRAADRFDSVKAAQEIGKIYSDICKK